MKYRAKSVVIEAILFDGNLHSINQMVNAWPTFKDCAEWRQLPELLALKIKTLEGDHRANSGDFIVKGTLGEFYPCKPSAFHNKYEAIEREHIESVDCWCGPELAGDYSGAGGVKHYVHKESQ